MELVAADIGGTHARFALAQVNGGRVSRLEEPVTMLTAEHASFQTAWQTFVATLGRPAPRAAAIAVAAPVGPGVLKLTNNPWVIHPALIAEQLAVDAHVLINDFGAVGHAVANAAPEDLVHLCGPDRPFAPAGLLSVVGPGTGLGVAQVLRADDRYHVIETEGGHIDFAPLDAIEDTLLLRLRAQFTRVSAERIVAGGGIVAIYQTLAAIEGRTPSLSDERAIWAAALAGGDGIATAALDRFFLALGAVTGDLALAHGAAGVVIAGGLGLRLRKHFAHSGFAERFVAKGRFQSLMAAKPVKLIVHPQPGLFGAAAAFAQSYPN